MKITHLLKVMFVGLFIMTLTACQQTDGLLWKQQIEGFDVISEVALTPSGDVVVAGGGHVRFDDSGLDTVPADRHLLLLDKATGETKWKTSHVTDGFGVDTPFVHEDTIYHGSKNTLTSYDLKDGSEHWQYQLGERDSLNAPPIFFDGHIYFGSFHPYFISLDSKTGAEKSKLPLERISERLVIEDGSLYYTNGFGVLYRFEIGTEIPEPASSADVDEIFTWYARGSTGYTEGPPHLSESTVSVVSNQDVGLALVYDKNTGEVLQRYVDDEEFTGSTANDRSLYLITQKAIKALDTESGEILWTHDQSVEGVYSHLIHRHQKLYVVYYEDGDSEVRVHEPQTGEALKAIHIPGKITKPVISDGLLVTSTDKGEVYAVSLE